MHTSPFRALLISALAALVGLGVLGAGPSVAKAPKPPTWAPVETAAIHPGVQTVTGGAQCTANFVFVDKRNRVYLGQAAHCGGSGESNDTNGCEAPAAVPGAPVEVFNLAGDVVARGTLAYNSWFTMQRRKEADPATCQFNDFALIRLPKAAAKTVNPSIPVFGGPTGLRTTPIETGERLLTYGNSGLRFGITAFSPKTCVALGDDAQVYNGTFFTPDDGWAHDHVCPNAGVPGDSGSAYVDSQGRAVGVLSFLNLVPPGTNTTTDLAKELAYAQRYSGIKKLSLVKGTEPFSPNAVAR